MRLVKASAVVLLTFFWVLATNHCALEQFVGLEFLTCSGGHEAGDPDQNNDCENDGCALVENQLYKAEDTQATDFAPAFLLAAILALGGTELPAPPNLVCMPSEAVPPEISRVWQFSRRAALPPRAPSHLS